MTKTFSVYYQTGGSERFQWHIVLDAYPTADAADEKRDALRRMGYPAHSQETALLHAIGLPETYEDPQPLLEHNLQRAEAQRGVAALAAIRER